MPAVGADQHLEEVVPELVVEVAAEQDGVAHLLAEAERGAVHPPGHAPPPGLPLGAADQLARHLPLLTGLR